MRAAENNTIHAISHFWKPFDVLFHVMPFSGCIRLCICTHTHFLCAVETWKWNVRASERRWNGEAGKKFFFCLSWHVPNSRKLINYSNISRTKCLCIRIFFFFSVCRLVYKLLKDLGKMVIALRASS